MGSVQLSWCLTTFLRLLLGPCALYVLWLWIESYLDKRYCAVQCMKEAGAPWQTTRRARAIVVGASISGILAGKYLLSCKAFQLINLLSSPRVRRSLRGSAPCRCRGVLDGPLSQKNQSQTTCSASLCEHVSKGVFLAESQPILSILGTPLSIAH